jgi:hypothetical protein
VRNSHSPNSTVGASLLALAYSAAIEKSDQNEDRQQTTEDRPLFQVVELAITLFQFFATQTDLVDLANKRLIPPVLSPASFGAPAADITVAAEPAIERCRPAILHRPLDVAEQDDAIVLSVVFSA